MNRSLIQYGLAVALAASTPALAEPPIDKASPTTGPDGAPLTADDYKELNAIQDAIGAFESASKDYRGTVTHIVRQEYDKKRRELIAKYDEQINVVEAEEKQRRLEAIALFEKFLAKYPSDNRWTPDVIFRLAELYFERSNDEYQAAFDAAQKAQDAGNKEASAAPPSPDYGKTIDLYKRLITEFPDYRLLDGAIYLLGYCLGEMNKEPEARQAYLALVCQNKYKALDPPAAQQPTKSRMQVAATAIDPYKDCQPVKGDSRFVPEAWTRIGEDHFDSNELDLAIAAYARVLQYKDSPYYDKALYKLAWSYYRADKYPESIRKFDDLVVYSDTKKSESGKEGSDLRQEAVQYLGISFAEKDWNGDGIDDPESGLQRIETFYKGRDNEPHVRDIYQKLGDIYFDETEYARAVEVYKRLLQKGPLAPDNPKIQDRVVLAFERMRNFNQALKEREELAKGFTKGTDWYKHNRDNKAALDSAAELAEQALVKYAVDHHKAAQNLKKLAFATKPPDGRKLEQASQEYAMAADGYAKYLEQYPNSKNTYDYTFFYAESLYYSQRFADAAIEYEKVRDSNLDNRFLEDAAFNAVKSYENLVDFDTRSGKLTPPPMPEPGKVPVPVQPLAMPESIKRLQAAYDAFVERVPSSGKVATMAYKAGEIDFKYLNFDKARTRLQTVIDKYCKDDVAVQAGNAILTSYTVENNLDQILAWTDKLKNSKCGSEQARTVAAGGWMTLENDAKFHQADVLFNNKDYEKAAAAYIKLVDADPKNKGGNNDKALNNAAVGYEKVNRFAAATKIYERIVNEYPKSPFVDDALFRTAVNYQRFFEFDKAVVSYERLASDPRFKDSQHRLDALYNSAVILENDQDYANAAKLFQQYARDPKVKREDQAEAYFRSGTIYLKNKDAKRAIDTFNGYVKSYPGNAAKTIEAEFHIAEAYDQMKNHPAAMAAYRRVAEMGAQVPAASDAAEFPAHAAFIEAEAKLPELEKMQLAGGKEFPKSFEKFKAKVAELTADYNKVVNYRRATWTLAGYFRIGYVYELLSRALANLLNAPCPPEIMRKFKQEGCDVYLEQLQQQIGPLTSSVDDEVVKRYRVVLEQAGKLGVANDWTKLARQRASAYKPDEFPVNKDEHIEMQLENP